MEKEIAKLIDHTALGTDVSAAKVDQLCQEARKFGFKTVCVHPCRVEQAVQRLKDTDIGVGTVCGFPFGADMTSIKVQTAKEAANKGISDIDMVMNVGLLKDGRLEDVADEISEVAAVCGQTDGHGRIVLKVIIEACLLTDEEKSIAATIVRDAGADFVKTSTGYLGPGTGANNMDVSILRRAVGTDIGVKASGGIRTLGQMNELVEAGANRIGTSAGVAIMNEEL